MLFEIHRGLNICLSKSLGRKRKLQTAIFGMQHIRLCKRRLPFTSFFLKAVLILNVDRTPPSPVILCPENVRLDILVLVLRGWCNYLHVFSLLYVTSICNRSNMDTDTDTDTTGQLSKQTFFLAD